MKLRTEEECKDCLETWAWLIQLKLSGKSSLIDDIDTKIEDAWKAVIDFRKRKIQDEEGCKVSGIQKI